MPKALITGVAGQDGSYLAELLLGKEYEVLGLIRAGSESGLGTARIDHLLSPAGANSLTLAAVDLAVDDRLESAIAEFEPDEIYNLAAQSFIPASFSDPEATDDVNALVPARIVETIRAANRPIRFFQASSCEIFGDSAEIPQSESTQFSPQNPYAASKLSAHDSVVRARETDGIFASNGILFNHESPRRPLRFVTRKITHAAARIKLGMQDKLLLGNLEVRKDWGFAGDYVEAMWLMLQQGSADDFVIASGESHSLKEFLGEAFGYLDLDWHDYVEVDPEFFRPTDPNYSEGDPSKAERTLGWRRKLSFRELVDQMVDRDLQLVTAGISDDLELVRTSGV